MDEEIKDTASAKKADNFLPASILIAAILISGSIIYTSGGGPRPAGSANLNPVVAASDTKAPASDRDVILGEADAKVTIIEYGDYQCPFCGRFFEQTEPLIRENYIKTGKVKMAYRNLAFLGPESVEAAEAAECAKDQSKFWAYHDALYTAEIEDGAEHNGNLNKTLFVKLANDVNLDVPKFTECYDSNKYAGAVTDETEAAQAAGINSTPTIFINDQEVKGAQPYATFKAIIDSLL